MTGTLPDLERVRAFLREWRDGEISLERLEVEHVKARPDGSLRVLYEAPGARDEIVRISARRVRPGDGPRLEKKINELHRGRRVAGLTQAAVYAPVLGLLFEAFPADQGLESLPVAADGRAMAPLLQAALASRTGGAQVREVAVQPVRYKPTRKCLFRYEIQWAGPGTRGLPAVVYAKLARPAKFERTRETLRRLRDAAEGLAFDLPEPIGEVPELCMELFSAVPGVRLFTLAESADYPALCGRVGAALHQFHALPVVLDQEWGLEAKMGELAESAAQFSCLLPAARERIEGLCGAVSARLRASPPPSPRPIHGDFHGDNVLVDGGRIALIDLEDCAMGDPAEDVGANWAQLTCHSIKAAGRTPMAEAGRRAFLDAYLQRADAETAERIPAHAAMHCFLYAHQCLRHPRHPARYEDADAMLGACVGVLERGLG